MRKNSDPFESLFESLEVILDASFEDTDVTPEERKIAKHRFAHALKYIIINTMEVSNANLSMVQGENGIG